MMNGVPQVLPVSRICFGVNNSQEPITKPEDAGDKELLEVLQSDRGDISLPGAAMNDESDDTELLQVLDSKKDNATAPILNQVLLLAGHP